jgi:hypothetical protein
MEMADNPLLHQLRQHLCHHTATPLQLPLCGNQLHSTSFHPEYVRPLLELLSKVRPYQPNNHPVNVERYKMGAIQIITSLDVLKKTHLIVSLPHTGPIYPQTIQPQLLAAGQATNSGADSNCLA